MRGFALAATISHVAAHVAMNMPPAWQDPDGRYGLKSGCAHSTIATTSAAPSQEH